MNREAVIDLNKIIDIYNDYVLGYSTDRILAFNEFNIVYRVFVK